MKKLRRSRDADAEASLIFHGELKMFSVVVCRDTHFCKITTNTTQVPAYREFVQGAVSSFLVTFVQGRVDTFNLFTNKTFIPFELLELKTDLNCIVN